MRARDLLHNALHSLATIEQIAETLGIQSVESQPEEFWETQKRASVHRFYWFLLNELNIPLSHEFGDLTLQETEALAVLANEWLRNGIDYEYIRNWYKIVGEFQVDMAFKLRREQRDLATRCLNVLFIFEKGARWGKFGKHTVLLVDGQADASNFPVSSVSQLEKSYLAEMAKHFEHIGRKLGAKQVKVLPGRLPEQQPAQLNEE